MPRANRKRKNIPQRKPKTIKFNQNEIEIEERKAAAVSAVEDVVATTSTKGSCSTASAIGDAITHAHAINDEIAVTDGGDNCASDEDGLNAADDECTSNYSPSFSLSHLTIIFESTRL